MFRFRPLSGWAATLALALSAAACADLPPGTPPSSTGPASPAPAAAADCAALAPAIAQAEAARSAAAAEQQQAWKAVVPFVVAARYASAGSAEREAAQRLADLQAQASAQGCDAHGR